MYRIFLSSILCFFIILQAVSQEPVRSDRRVMVHVRGYDDQVQVERIAFFTEKIGLTSAEAQVFWPIYNEMDKKRTALFEERASIMQKFVRDADQLNDRQINEHLNRLAAVQQQETALPAEYDTRFRQVLSSRKVMNLYVAEMEFRNHLLQRMRERRPERIERQ